jgi:hypothetical protein
MRYLFIFLSPLVFLSLNAQTIKRWSGGKQEIKNQQLSYTLKRDIFSDHGWTQPDVVSRPINFDNGSYEFSLGGKTMSIKQGSADNILLEGGRSSLQAERKKVKGKYYYAREKLKLKPVTRYRWVSHTTTMSQTVPVVRYRSVTRYQYDYATKTSRPVTTQESYTTYETRWVPKTDWRWEGYTAYEYDIPEYSVYSFVLPDSTHLMVYEDTVGGQKKYYLQNASYALATDESGTHYILIDENLNGNYSDPEDKIMFNTWNPYAKGSSYRNLRFFKENSWFDIKYLLEEYFVDIQLADGQFKLDYANNKYAAQKGKGKVNFIGVPKEAEIVINEQKYRPKKSFKSEYGVFKVTIKQKNYLDFVTTYEVDADNPEKTITYQAAGGAAPFSIKNIFAEDYFVTVSNENGYERTYHNTSELNVPPGSNEITIYTNGFTATYSGTFSAGTEVEYDFEKEVKKLNEENKDAGK